MATETGKSQQRNYRFSKTTLDQIDEIHWALEGLQRTRIVENAIALYHTKVMGKFGHKKNPKNSRNGD